MKLFFIAYLAGLAVAATVAAVLYLYMTHLERVEKRQDDAEGASDFRR